MGLDIRLPIGLLFSIFGILLIAFGMVSDKGLYQRSLGININLYWGMVMLLFGAVMLLLGRWRPNQPRPGEEAARRARP
jgi:hypothetical protein